MPTGSESTGPLYPEQMPEALAAKSLMDEFQAELHADYHGTGMQFRGYIMAENSGAAYSNISLRSYKHEITRQMDQAALAEGYPSDQLEQDAERIFWGPELQELGSKLWKGRPLYYAATYGYERFHTLAFANENAWERSSFLRHRRLLEIGQEIWPGEYYPGYPTRVILKNELHFVTAYGNGRHTPPVPGGALEQAGADRHRAQQSSDGGDGPLRMRHHRQRGPPLALGQEPAPVLQANRRASRRRR